MGKESLGQHSVISQHIDFRYLFSASYLSTKRTPFCYYWWRDAPFNRVMFQRALYVDRTKVKFLNFGESDNG